jgi:glutamine phosphoribosylpyrophosphate amidotransferase
VVTICGIIGYCGDGVNNSDLGILKKVMIESSIRGRHASGAAWFDGNKICSLIKPVPIDELVDIIDFKKLLYETNKISFIAHSRYCTSNIEHNQPIVSSNLAIVHNGVVSQESYDTWESKYGYKCTGKNDSELILRAIENGDNPLTKFPDASIASISLDSSGNIKYFRNARRPIWIGKVGNGTMIASTYDILKRAGVRDIHKVEVENDLQKRDGTVWKT